MRLKSTALALALFSAASAAGLPAMAGIYTDDLSRCLAKSATARDQSALMQWMFSAITANPALKPLSSITPDQRASFTRAGAQLMQRLIVVDCRKEAVTAIKFEGTGAFEQSFAVLGQVAVRGMMSNQAVGGEMNNLNNFIEKDKIAGLFKEAGVPVPGPN